MSLSLFAEPATEPILLADAKLHLKVENTDEDALIDSLISTARRSAENQTHRALITQTWDLNLDRFPTCFEIPNPPLISVTHVKYYDSSGVLQTVDASDYIVDAPAGPQCLPGRIALAVDASWPTAQTRINAVTIRFVAGYGDAGDVPEDIKAALKLIVGHLYANRESVVITQRGSIVQEMPQAAEWLLGPYMLVGF